MKSMSKWLNIFIYLLEKMYNYTLFLRECDFEAIYVCISN